MAGNKKIYPSLEEAPEFENVMIPSIVPAANDADVAMLHKGSTLWKFRSSDSWYRRRYWVDGEHFRLHYEPSRKPFWSNAKQHVDLIDIKDARLGWKTDVFNRAGRQAERERAKDPQRPALLVEKNCFSVLFAGDDNKTLDLVATDEQTAASWVRGLKALMLMARQVHQRKNDSLWLKLLFNKADKDRSGGLNYEESISLLATLNIKIDPIESKKMFEMSNVNKRKIKGKQALDADEFIQFYQLLLIRPEFDVLFQKYSEGESMSLKALGQFLEVEQGVKTDDVERLAVDLIRRYEPSPSKEMGRMTLSGFTALLDSPFFDIMDENHRRVNQDMTRPLNHYYIASSHNTYLTGNQLTSDSSIEAYINVLESGCRCVELDVWDGEEGEPVVTHGNTLTSKVLVKDVLNDAIKTSAFKHSDYPLILSVENHLGAKQQGIFASHLVNILGNLLYDVRVDDLSRLPSPEQLRNKIIVRGKKVPIAQTQPTDDNNECDQVIQDNEQTPTKSLIDLINICESIKFESLDHSKESHKFFHTVAISEGKGLELMQEDNKADFVQLTERQLVKIYPAGSRTGSSNFSPFPFWSVGCQILAFNYQDTSKVMRMYRGWFRQNGNCGYVLKPTGAVSAPKVTKYLKVRIISGQHLPKVTEKESSIVDPYVTLKINGSSDEFGGKTRFIVNNGFNPHWNESMEVFLQNSELAVVCFTVKDKQTVGKSQFIGAYSLPFICLKSGYWNVPLLSNDGESLSPASIFVQIEIKDLN